MLSYQHIYHAGNHADILKHLTLLAILEHLNAKKKPYTVFDTHAGAGCYSLDDERALKTGEAENGIRKLLAAISDYEKNGNEKKLLKNQNCESTIFSKYISMCRAYKDKTLYPGSPEIERCMMRNTDTLILSELHPQAIEELKIEMQMPVLFNKKEIDTVVPHIHFRDGWETLKALTPPLVKRGLAIMDPSYEDESDYTKCADVLCSVHKKWPAGVLALWYPLISRRKNEINNMIQKINETAHNGAEKSDVLNIQLCVTTPESMTGLASLYGSGMLIVNTPYMLDESIKSALPFIASTLGGEKGKWNITQL